MFTSCDITSYDHIVGEVVTKTAYANPNHHNKSKFSFVSINGENDEGVPETWYARVIGFLEFSLRVNNDNGNIYCFTTLYIFNIMF